MTDTTDRPPIHLGLPGAIVGCGASKQTTLWTDRDQDVTCVECWGYRRPGHSHTIKQVCRPETCTGHPRWVEIRADELVAAQVLAGSGRVRATIALEKIARLLPRGKIAAPESTGPASDVELADALEVLYGTIEGLQQRASSAETERDAYREAVAGGRAWLGLVVPELVYPQRVALGSPDDWNDERPMAPGMLHVLPPDPLTLLRQEVADLTAAVGRLADRGRERPEPTACRADQFCEATAHYVGCPSYTTAPPKAGPGCWAPGCTLGGGHPGQHHPWHHDQAAYDRACQAHHPGELCKPGKNHPGAN